MYDHYRYHHQLLLSLMLLLLVLIKTASTAAVISVNPIAIGDNCYCSYYCFCWQSLSMLLQPVSSTADNTVCPTASTITTHGTDGAIPRAISTAAPISLILPPLQYYAY